MAIEITIPRLGWNMEEGVFVGWLKQDGDEVRPGDALFTLEGEKATEDIECLDKGILRVAPGGPKAGDRVPVGAVIGHVTQAGEEAPADGEWSARPAAAVPAGEAHILGPNPPPAPAERAPHSPAASPRARRVARELGVDWKQVHGGGRSGRIRERDVRAAAVSSPKTIPQGGGIAVSPIRRTIAERMTASLRATAPVTLTTTVDVSNLVNLRNQFKAIAGAQEVVPGYTDFLVKLAAAALQKHPMLAARWVDEEIILPETMDVAVAVDAEAGLFVAVVRDVASLSVRQVAVRTRDLADKARRGALASADMQGGVFTITNLGAFGVDAFTPIIHYPQCAILGVGRIQRRPAADGDRIVARDQVTLSLTFDHRIVDGAPAARFLQTLSKLLENPGPSLMP